MGKPPGWMDHPHEVTRTEAEADFLSTYRMLTLDQREALERLANEFSKLNKNSPPDQDSPRDRPVQ